MLLADTLKPQQSYFKSTLLDCLKDAFVKTGKPVITNYKSILRREKQGIIFYTRVHRDPGNGYRLYTGKQIQDIVRYEITLKGGSYE